MKFEDIKWSAVLDSIAMVATPLNPAVASGLKVASQVVNKIQLPDEVLEKETLGLSRTADSMIDTVKNLTLSQSDKDNRIMLLAENLKDLAEIDRQHNLLMR